MKLRVLPLLLAGAASAAWAEDCPLVLNQRFRLHYNQWQVSEGPTTTSTQAVYEVDAGIPVFTYRLGALALNGAVEYNRLAFGGQSDAQTGISRYGARLSLFPYRPFRIYMDFQRSTTPDLFDSGRIHGQTWGAGITYGSRLLQDLRLSYRNGRSELGELNDDWSLWRLEANQQVSNTRVNLLATRQEFRSFGSDQGWRLFIANLDTDSYIGREWVLRTRSQAQDSETSRFYELSANLYGPVSGNLHSLTLVSAGATLAGAYRTGHTFGSESLVYARGRWHTHASASFSQASTPELGQGVRIGSSALGATYSLSGDWRVHGDTGISRVRQTFAWQDASRTATTVNLGVARGGDVPELIRHTLFLFSDWSFERRIREEYPPDFIPSELAQDIFRRRMRQTGTFGFTADLWRMTDNQNQGRMDWARVTGQVQTRGAFTLYLAGDYRHDLNMTQVGLNTRTANLVANSSYRLGATNLTASLGYSNYQQTLSPASGAIGWVPSASALDGQSRHFSLGATSALGRLPIGVMVLRYEPPLTYPTTTATTWADLTFRQVAFRVRYEWSRMDNGFRSSRITLDLLRWFDTLCTGSPR